MGNLIGPRRITFNPARPGLGGSVCGLYPRSRRWAGDAQASTFSAGHRVAPNACALADRGCGHRSNRFCLLATPGLDAGRTGLASWDPSVTAARKRLNFQFLVEFFDAFNRVNFNEPSLRLEMHWRAGSSARSLGARFIFYGGRYGRNG